METNQLTFEHICFKYKGNDNQLFTDLDVTMETGQVVGILGASGSGKTTLTEILLGQLKPTCQQFRILENGKPVTAGSRSWSYVPQQNLLREYLKVSETFDFYADHHLKGRSHNYLGMQISKPQLNCHVTPNQLHGCTQYTYFAPDNRSMVHTVTTIPTI